MLKLSTRETELEASWWEGMTGTSQPSLASCSIFLCAFTPSPSPPASSSLPPNKALLAAQATPLFPPTVSSSRSPASSFLWWLRAPQTRVVSTAVTQVTSGIFQGCNWNCEPVSAGSGPSGFKAQARSTTYGQEPWGGASVRFPR